MSKKVWLVTGCSKGLGKALVEELIAQGYDEIRPYYCHVETCQQTVPEEMRAAYELFRQNLERRM